MMKQAASEKAKVGTPPLTVPYQPTLDCPLPAHPWAWGLVQPLPSTPPLPIIVYCPLDSTKRRAEVVEGWTVGPEQEEDGGGGGEGTQGDVEGADEHHTPLQKT